MHGNTAPVATSIAASITTTEPESEPETGNRTLLLRTPNGATLRLNHQLLRAACPCAGCRAKRLRGEIRLVEADVTVSGSVPMGYGLQLIFSDGHDRGIYPWRYLHELAGW